MTPKFIEEVKRIFKSYFGEGYEITLWSDNVIATKHLVIFTGFYISSFMIAKQYPACIENQQTKTKVNLVIMEIEELIQEEAE